MSKTPGRIAAVAAVALLAAPAHAQLTPDMQTAVLMAVIAERGGVCGALAPWEAATLRSEARRVFDQFEPAERVAHLADARMRARNVECDDAGMLGWIEARRGAIETEYLPKFLAAYRALALMEPPPAAFAAATLRIDYGRAIRAIDSRFAAFEVEGVAGPGGADWLTYMDRMGAAVPARAAALTSADGFTGRGAPDDAAAYIVESARITELWLDAALGED